MEKVINQLQQAYPDVITNIEAIGAAEINITVDAPDLGKFSQELQDHLVSIIDELTIIKINILDTSGEVKDSFATNQ